MSDQLKPLWVSEVNSFWKWIRTHTKCVRRLTKTFIYCCKQWKEWFCVILLAKNIRSIMKAYYCGNSNGMHHSYHSLHAPIYCTLACHITDGIIYTNNTQPFLPSQIIVSKCVMKYVGGDWSTWYISETRQIWDSSEYWPIMIQNTIKQNKY